ncbi:hypothetical protein NL676_032148 [Syzygium grande]|nr:hypothetical protein NL676_032148 [Syzygium grande]
MASLKAEKPAGSQLPGQAKQEPPKQSGSAPKAPATKPAPKKAEPKPAQPRKKLLNFDHVLPPFQLAVMNKR